MTRVENKETEYKSLRRSQREYMNCMDCKTGIMTKIMGSIGLL